jgi:peptidoglycan hydrolase FlgJ
MLNKVVTPASQIEQLRAKVPEKERAVIKQAAEDFESLFMGIVLKSMRNTVNKSGLIDGGHAEEVYGSMLDDEYSKMMSAQRHTGIADEIERFLLESQVGRRPESSDGLKAYQAHQLQDQGKQAIMEASKSKASLPFKIMK